MQRTIGHRPGATIAAAIASLLALTATACGSSGRELRSPAPGVTSPVATTVLQAPSSVQAAFALASSSFQRGAAIPLEFTCDAGDGRGVSPPLSWSTPPANTQELALVLYDPDADRVHWVIGAIPLQTTGLAQGSSPVGAFVGKNASGTTGYLGPCPPDGETHRYNFTLYALNQPVELNDTMDATQQRVAIESTPGSRATLQTVFGRS